MILTELSVMKNKSYTNLLPSNPAVNPHKMEATSVMVKKYGAQRYKVSIGRPIVIEDFGFDISPEIKIRVVSFCKGRFLQLGGRILQLGVFYNLNCKIRPPNCKKTPQIVKSAPTERKAVAITYFSIGNNSPAIAVGILTYP